MKNSRASMRLRPIRAALNPTLIIVLALIVCRCASMGGQQQNIDQQGDQTVDSRSQKSATQNSESKNEFTEGNSNSDSNSASNSIPENIIGGADGDFGNGDVGSTNSQNSVAVNNVINGTSLEGQDDSLPQKNGIVLNEQGAGLNSQSGSTLAPSATLQNGTSIPAAPVQTSEGNSAGKLTQAPDPQKSPQTAPQNVSGSPGTLSWVGYNYNKSSRKLDVQIVSEGAPSYRIFQEVNRGGQSEIVIRYLNTKLRKKIRRDIDASEFRSPVAYIRMRHDPAFTHTDVVVTLRENIQPVISTKGSNIMLTFDVSEKWIAPKGEQRPIAAAEIIQDDNQGLSGSTVETALPGEAPKQQAAYVADPGKEAFSGNGGRPGAPLIPKQDSENELIPDDGKQSPASDGNELLQNDSQGNSEDFYTIMAVAQGDFQSDIPGTSSFDTNQLLEDVPAGQAMNTNSSITSSGTADIVGVAAGSVKSIGPSKKKVLRLEFRDAPVSQIIRMIANESNINFVISPEAGSKRTSISLKNVPWDVALKVVLDSNRLGMQEMAPGVVRVDFLKTFTEDKDAEEKAKQSTEALIPTKVLVMALNYAKAEDAAKLAKDMLPKPTDSNNVAQKRNYDRFKAQADVRSNSVIIEATPNVLATVKTLIERLDSQTPQVRIASRLVEVNSSISNGLGFQWGSPFSFDPGRGLGFGSLPFPNYVTSQFSVDTGLPGSKGGSAAIRFGSINNVLALDLKLKMYEDQRLAETIQTEDVVVQDNEVATVSAGSSDYFELTGSASVASTLAEVVYSLSLNVRPHITADGAVQMKLDIKGDSPVPDPKGKAGKSSRSLSTTLLKQSGETAVIGGLYTSEVSKTVVGVPFLSSIPIIGALFKTTESANKKKDLLIMVTPTILGQSSASSAGSAGVDIPSPGVAAAASNSPAEFGGNSASNEAAPPKNSAPNEPPPSEGDSANSQKANTVPANYSNDSSDL